MCFIFILISFQDCFRIQFANNPADLIALLTHLLSWSTMVFINLIHGSSNTFK